MKAMLTEPIQGRVCGSCGACCFLLAIKELDKPIYKYCSHFCGKCQIYDDRPQSCRDFECLWLKGYIPGDDRRRPDNFGVMFSAISGFPGVGPQIIAWETRPGAFKERKVQIYLHQLAESIIVLTKSLTREWDVLGPAGTYEIRCMMKIRLGELDDSPWLESCSKGLFSETAGNERQN